MSAVWAALIAFLQSLVAPIQQMLASLATYNAGQTAADDVARKAQDDAQAKADAAREAVKSNWERDPETRLKDDGFERAD